MILTRADGKSMFMGFGWVVEGPLPDAPAEAHASVTYAGVTRPVRQDLEEVMDTIIRNAHHEAATALKPEPETYSELVNRLCNPAPAGA